MHVTMGAPDAETSADEADVPPGAVKARYTISVGEVPVRFAGYEKPGLIVLCATFPGYAVAVLSRNWPLQGMRLVRVTDLAPYT